MIKKTMPDNQKENDKEKTAAQQWIEELHDLEPGGAMAGKLPDEVKKTLSHSADEPINRKGKSDRS